MNKAYDPYAPQQPGTLGMAWDYFNPVELLKWKYKLDPRAYSLSEGLYFPIGGKLSAKSITQWAQKSGQLISERGAIRGGLTSFKNLFGTIGKERRLGRGILEGAQAIKAGRAKISQRAMRGLGQDLYKYGIPLKHQREIGNIISNQVAEYLDDLYSSGKRLTHMGLVSRISKATKSEDFIQRFGGRIETKEVRRIVKRMGKPARLQGAAGRAAGKLGARGVGTLTAAKALKPMLFAGKAMAWIGLATTMWDLTQMVGAPVGRMLIQSGDEILSRIENRFMPEMGGQLSLTYLSRGASTERQRAVEAISKSRINGRSALGQEAMMMHS